MAVKKISISRDAEASSGRSVLLRPRTSRCRHGCPQAAEEAAVLAEAHEALAEYIATYREPDPEDMAATRGRLDEAGIDAYETAEERAVRMAALARLRGESRPEPGLRAG
jgi:hypothetical protein